VDPILFIATTPNHCTPLSSYPVTKTTFSRKSASTAAGKNHSEILVIQESARMMRMKKRRQIVWSEYLESLLSNVS
jgi:hypothetical protein